MITLIDQLLELARSEAPGEVRGREATARTMELAHVIEQVYQDMAPHGRRATGAAHRPS
jgi:hypothetical protein